MSRFRSRRRLLLATCLPYVVWCLVGHWLHGLTDCGHAHAVGHCAAERHHSAEHHQHGHASPASQGHEHSPPTGAALLAADEDHACPFCDFIRQGVTPAESVPLAVCLGFRELAATPVSESAVTRPALTHLARGPPRV